MASSYLRMSARATPRASGADDLDLVHRNAAGDLGAILGKRHRQDAADRISVNCAVAVQPLGPELHLPQAFDRRGEPGEAVCGVLGVVHAARFLDLEAHAGLGAGQNLVGRGHGFLAALDQAARSGGQKIVLVLQLGDGHARWSPAGVSQGWGQTSHTASGVRPLTRAPSFARETSV